MKNIVSDKAEKTEAANSLKNGQKEQFSGINARGTSIDSFPLYPVGPGIYLEYNLGDDGAVMLKQDDQQMKHPYFTVIGIGATVSTVNLGDRLLLKPNAKVESFITDDLPGVDTFKYHLIFDHSILGIVK
jgi:hypothetical protein